MAPEQHASLASLARLRAEIQADRGAMATCLADVRDGVAMWSTAPPGRPYQVVAAVALHGWYTALEAVMERTVRSLDRAMPTGEAWHRELLSQAMVEVPGVRPALLARTLYAEILSLLDFRHFFRHAYGVPLDPDKLRQNLDRLLRVAAPVDQGLDTFDAFLAEAMRVIGS